MEMEELMSDFKILILEATLMDKNYELAYRLMRSKEIAEVNQGKLLKMLEKWKKSIESPKEAKSDGS